MFKQRLLTGTVLGLFYVLLIGFSHVPWFIRTIAAIMSIQAIFELYRATGIHHRRALLLVTYAAAVLIAFADLPWLPYLIGILVTAIILSAVFLMKRLRRFKRVPTWLVMLWSLSIAVFFRTLADLRSGDTGLAWLMLTVLIATLTDIAAYLCGKHFGNKKIAPTISPHKTAEGCIGGIFCTLIVLLTVASLLDTWEVLTVNYGLLTVYVLAGSLLAQFGDLCFSAVKRISGVKDYGTLLPGHGGLLDRFDSLLLLLPISYCASVCGLPLFT